MTVKRLHYESHVGVYSVIVRLEPRGEAKSTAELYLSGKGTVLSQAAPFMLLFSFRLCCYFNALSLSPFYRN